jgi:UDP-N-acetylmuramyl pentapeptide synthase
MSATAWLAALTALEPLLAEDLTVLIKGSRVMGLEKLAAALCSAPASQAEGGSC